MAQINTATRPFFAAARKAGGQAFFEGEVTFGWHSGMSWQVRQRSSDAMRGAILERYASGGLLADDVLEVSTASHDYETGQALSAMNLIYADPDTRESHPVENWFQASKVYCKDGRDYGPYRELCDVRLGKRYINPHPDKKTIERLKDDPLFTRIQGEIAGAEMSRFELCSEVFPLVPRSAFYDYLYVSALVQPQNKELSESLLSYRVFTDIMFNPGSGKRRRFNTQARSCAIYVALSNRGLLGGAMLSFEDFVGEVGYETEEVGNQDRGQSRLF